ncbi:class II fructose-bisphosphate aldolase [Microbacterium sp. Leaf436]|uniref:class II fructose-bisphosphate aldolase n=1 Tax=Microbacterium sp. Leaf436 TaxID=1736377 RepID=UPI0006FE3AF4|nr:class II fructose-bisphosphate aldolase [Microbacterium sp. Leaf436]KQT71936.1 fructose-bisphosphate aldolase [Microbacterium sp. Leaf436]
MTTFRSLLDNARAHQSAIGSFNVVLLEHAEAIAGGAAAAGTPVIFQISENCIGYHGGLKPILAATQAIGRDLPVQALVHLDHITDVDMIRQGVDLGVDSVMFDGAHLSFVDNVSTTAQVVEICHRAGVGVEAELGVIGGKNGVHAPGVRTNPFEAAAFVGDTGVDALAVAVGSSHAMQQRTAQLDIDLINDIARAVPVPLVLHGSSGVSDDDLSAAVASGMAKINISTHLNGLFTRAIREVLQADSELTDPRKYIAPARAAVVTETARLLTILRSGPLPPRG